MKSFPDKFFVSGTDTGIGKTVVSAMLTLGLGGSYWKPVQSGLHEETDTEFVKRVTGLEDPRIIEERYRLREPLSPHASAALDQVTIQLHDFELPRVDRSPLVVEGAGGLLVPLNEHDLIIDLIDYLELPVLLVSRSGLGTLNHTFLSLEALRSREIPIIGVVMNGPKNQSNRQAIEHFGNIEVLAELPPLREISATVLKNEFEKYFSQG